MIRDYFIISSFYLFFIWILSVDQFDFYPSYRPHLRRSLVSHTSYVQTCMAIPTSRHASTRYRDAILQKNKDVAEHLSNYLLRANFSVATTFNKYRLDTSPCNFVLICLDNLHLNLVQQMCHSMSSFSSQLNIHAK